MRNRLSLIVVNIVMAFNAWAGGNGVNNGGDAVLCVKSQNNSFYGYYSLDYLAQYQKDSDAVAVQSLEESLARIEKFLAEKLPELSPSFQEFRKNIFNESDPTQKYLWEKSSFGLVDLQDENLLSLLPANCLQNGKVSIVQAVLRMSEYSSGRPLGKYLFRYVPEVIQQLKVNNSVQLSFLLVHEWLWSFSNIVDRNRRLNYWLHSDRLEKWSRVQWLENLSGIGFEIPTVKVDLFQEQLCPANEVSLNELLQTAPKVATDRFLILGYGQADEHGKLCRAQDGYCNNYFGSIVTVDGFNRFDFASYLYVALTRSGLEVYSQENGGKKVKHLSCPFDFAKQKIGACSNLTFTSGYQHDPVLDFRVTVGKNCIRFYEQNNVPMDKKNPQFINMIEYVLLFQKVEIPPIRPDP